MQERAFTGARSAAQREKIATRHFHVHAAQHLQRPLPQGVRLVDVFAAEQRFIHKRKLPGIVRYCRSRRKENRSPKKKSGVTPMNATVSERPTLPWARPIGN